MFPTTCANTNKHKLFADMIEHNSVRQFEILLAHSEAPVHKRRVRTPGIFIVQLLPSKI